MRESLLSFHPEGPRYQTQVARLGSRHLNPWNHLTGSLFSFIVETFLESYNPVNYIDVFEWIYVFVFYNELPKVPIKGSIVGKHSE